MKKYAQLSDCPLFQPGTDIEVWFMKREFFRDFNFGDFKGFDPKDPSKTHTLLGTCADPKPGLSYETCLKIMICQLQAERWSPNVEANELIRSKGLGHTSMSVGDCIRFRTGECFLCDNFGWKNF